MSFLHISVGVYCNNNCIFCMEDTRDNRSKISFLGVEVMAEILKKFRSSHDKVMFVTAEPTLNPNLISYIGLAKGFGFKTIGITTNGRFFKYKNFLVKAVKEGLNYIIFSIHGATASLHNRLTRTSRSFKQTVEGISNTYDLKKKGVKIKMLSSTVVSKLNLSEILNIYNFLKQYEFDEYIFNIMEPIGRGARFFKALMPSYTEIVLQFNAFFDTLRKNGDENIEKIGVNGLPPCMLNRLNVKKKFETEEGSIIFTEEQLLTVDSEIVEILKKEFAKKVFEKTYALSVLFKEKFYKTKTEKCNRCSLKNSCNGIWSSYIDFFGDSEISPL